MKNSIALKTAQKAVSSLILITISMVSLTACQKSDDSAEPEAPAPQINLEEKMTCDQPEVDMPYLTEASETVVDVKDELQLQQVEIKDCDGQVTKSQSPQIVSSLKKITIEPNADFDQKVSSIKISNFRTCTLKSVDVTEGPAEQQTIKLPDGQEMKIKPESVTTVDSDGKIELAVTDSEMMFQLPLNVRNGKNILEIKYFGKCLKRDSTQGAPADVQATPAPSTAEPTEINLPCLEAEEIGTQYVLLHVDITRTTIDGVSKVDTCEAPKKSKPSKPSKISEASKPSKPKESDSGKN